MTNGNYPPQQPPPGGTPPPGGAPPPQQPGGYPPPQQYGPPQPTSPQGAVLAHWWKRAVGALIDGAVVGIPAFILMAIVGIGTFQAAEIECDPVTGICTTEGGGGFVAFLLMYVLIFVLALAYQVYFNGGERGQTVGKMVMKIQVRDEATGGPIGYGKAAIRVLVAFALGLLCGIGQVVDLLFPLWDPKRQTLHDKVANSLVIDLAP